MKRFLVFILLITYSVATTGTEMHLHFCMGKLADWSLWGEQDAKTCGNCGMEKNDLPDNCCSDEEQWLKIQDDQKTSVVAFQFTQLAAEEPVHFFTNHQLLFSQRADLLPQSHAPPDFTSIAFYKLNCVFRI